MGNLLLFSGISLPRNLGTRLLVNFLAFVVSILYSLVGIVLEVVFMVANLDNVEMFKDMYQGMQDRFYIIIGIFMLFKVSMSMITYFANPDKLTDKEAGMGKIVTRMITVLILLILVPTFVFDFLGRIQQPLLNTVARIVLNTDGGLDYSGAHSKGQQMATVLLGGFFNVRDECKGDAAEQGDNIIEAITNLADEECSGDKKTFKYDFDFVGALFSIMPILVITIIIGVQVAIRAFKLIILKLLVPIPIIYYMDPKSMKDGGKTSAYMKLFMTTYLDLFIHFGALFFVVELMNILSTAWFNADFLIGGVTLAAKTGVIGLVFVIIGLLLFAFQAPKFVKKALGLKDSEFGAGLAGLLSTGAAMTGAIGAGVAGFGASAAKGGSFIQNFGAAASSAIRGGQAGYKAAGDKGDFTKVLGAVKDKNAQMAAERAAGSTGLGRIKTTLGSVFTGETEFARDEKRLKDLKDREKAAKQLKEYMVGEGKKKTAHIQQTMDVAGTSQTISLDDLNASINFANSANGDGMVHFADGSSYAVDSSVINKLKGDLEEGAGTIYAQEVDAGHISDSGALESFRGVLADNLGISRAELSSYQMLNNDGSIMVDSSGNPVIADLSTDAVKIKTIQKQTSTQSFELENSAAYARHKADAQATGKK